MDRVVGSRYHLPELLNPAVLSSLFSQLVQASEFFAKFGLSIGHPSGWACYLMPVSELISTPNRGSSIFCPSLCLASKVKVLAFSLICIIDSGMYLLRFGSDVNVCVGFSSVTSDVSDGIVVSPNTACVTGEPE